MTDDRDPSVIQWEKLRAQLLSPDPAFTDADINALIEIGDQRFFPKRPPDPASDEHRMQVTYTNYRGETAVREITPLSIAWGSNEWHEEPQFLLHVYDHDRGGAIRTYALKDCDFTNVAVAEKTLPEFSIDEVRARHAAAVEEATTELKATDDGQSFLEKIAEAGRGTVHEVGLLPDGSGFATMSFPLPMDHWLYAGQHLEAPPMPMRMLHGGHRHMMVQRITAAARYAIRAATMRGRDTDFDPDALVQNFVVGMLGYHTHDGLSSESWCNPDPVPPIWWPDTARGELVALAELVLRWMAGRAKLKTPMDPHERGKAFNEVWEAEQAIEKLIHKETTRV